MREIDQTNIDELLYELGGSKDIPVNWFKCRWWDIKRFGRNWKQKKLNSFERKFLLDDLQDLRYWTVKYRRLRFLDENERLRSALFKVKWIGGSCMITQYPGIALFANKPKGPMKFRRIECSSIVYKQMGLKRLVSWVIPFRGTL